MKPLIERAKDRVVTFEQLLDSRMNRLVRSGERDPQPLEVRNAILKEIQAQVVRDAWGGAVFPHAQVVVELLTGALPQGASLEPLTGDRLQAAARRLRNSTAGCRPIFRSRFAACHSRRTIGRQIPYTACALTTSAADMTSHHER